MDQGRIERFAGVFLVRLSRYADDFGKSPAELFHGMPAAVRMRFHKRKPYRCSFRLPQFPDAHCKIREILIELTEVHGGGCIGGDRTAVRKPGVPRDVIGLD